MYIRGIIGKGIEEALLKAREGMDVLKKAITTTTGFAIQSWEKGYKELIPITPTYFRDRVLFRGDASGSGLAWKYLKTMDTAKVMGYVAEGKRGAAVQVDTKEGSCGWSTWGIEDYYTQESEAQNAELIGQTGTVDLCIKNLMGCFAQKEERILWGANKDGYAMGTCPTPSAAVEVDASSTLSVEKYYAKAVALTHDGFMLATLASGVVKKQTVTTPVGETYDINGGCSIPSAASAAADIDGSGKRAKFTVVPREGDVAFAWYISTGSSDPGDSARYLQAITTSPVFYLTSDPVTSARQTITTLAVIADMSQVDIAPNGIFAQLVKTSEWVYWKILTPAESTLTITNGAVGVFETAILAMWDNLKIGPEAMVMNSSTYQTVNNLWKGDTSVKTNFVAEVFQIAGVFHFAARVKGYVNTTTGETINIEINNNIPDGMVVFSRLNVIIPGQASDRSVEVQSFGGVWRVDWLPITRSTYHGAYRMGGVKLYLPGAFAIIQGIKTSNYGIHTNSGFSM